MITTPTVLVLGAGASCPYGFPTAKGLKKHICDNFSGEGARGVRLLGNKFEIPRDRFLEFRQAFWRTGVSSVDAFLEHRSEFLEVGKLAIAYSLIPFEREVTLHNPPSDDDWYLYLSERLNTSFDEFENNKLAIITFNYDRSLEHYLFSSLMNWHGKSVDECIAKLSKIPIIHVYGQLGKIPYPELGCRTYQPLPDDDDFKALEAVRDAASGITLLHERASDLSVARNLLTNAERICFLGFGYHLLNLERLQLDHSRDELQVFGTALNLEPAEVQRVEQRLFETTLCRRKPKMSDVGNLTMLRRHLILD